VYSNKQFVLLSPPSERSERRRLCVYRILLFCVRVCVCAQWHLYDIIIAMTSLHLWKTVYCLWCH